MEKLTIKELAPYLPYGLKFKDIPEGYNGVRELTIFNLEWCLSDGKPILRNLSDLTSGQLIELFEIAHKQVYGFIDESLKNFHEHGWDENNFGLTVSNEVFIYGFSMDFEDRQDFRFSIRWVDEDSIQTSFLKLNKLELFQKLFEWHFDVFGLREKGLCIYYNEL